MAEREDRPESGVDDAIFGEGVDPDIVDSHGERGHGPDDGTVPPAQEQRAELANTVEALTGKLDVRARTRDVAADGARRAKRQIDEHQTVIAAMFGGVAVLTVAILLRRRCRRDRRRDGR